MGTKDYREVEVIDTGTAPEIFYSGILEPVTRNGITRTTFFSEREINGRTERVAVLHAVASDGGFQQSLRTAEGAMHHCAPECPRHMKMS